MGRGVPEVLGDLEYWAVPDGDIEQGAAYRLGRCAALVLDLKALLGDPAEGLGKHQRYVDIYGGPNGRERLSLYECNRHHGGTLYFYAYPGEGGLLSCPYRGCHGQCWEVKDDPHP